jgi:hypothetical protein
MARIFVNYRRDDAPGYAGRLFDGLAMHFGPGSVFLDVDATQPGLAFTEAIDRVVQWADAFLVVVGPSWLERDASGRRRIDDPEDDVRLEVAAALARDVPVIPVLVDHAQMPHEEDLPTELRPFARRTAHELRDESWQDDLARLTSALERIDRPDVGMARPPDAEASPPARRRSTMRWRKPKPAARAKKPPARSRRERPYWIGSKPPLNSMLREAALAGVVPEAVAMSLPMGTADPSKPLPPPSTSVGEGNAMYRPRPAKRSLRLVWAVLPLALLGAAGFVVAKWLLGWFVEGGTPLEGRDPVEAPGDVVACTVFAPPSASPGEMILVQAFAHLPEDAGKAADDAMLFDSAAVRRMYQSLELPVPVGGRLDFELRMPPGFQIDDPVASLIWRRKPAGVQFGVRVPKRTREQTVIATLHVRLDSVPVGRVKFKLNINRIAGLVPVASQPQGEQAHRYTVAFISYASTDRAQVLPVVRGLSVAGVRYFQDVLSLEPGDRWEQKLELGIDECDLFMLFWSSDAKKSTWVRREVRYALERQAGDELAPPDIAPIPIEDPPPRPWRELKHLHHNDRLLYFMRPPDAGSGPSP